MKPSLCLFVFSLAVVAIGCSDDDPGQQTGAWRGIVFDGSGSGVDLCDGIPAASNIAGSCENHSDCGDGGLCVVPSGSNEAECAQGCFPARCGDTCSAGTTCTDLVDDAGATVAHDVDGDEQPEEIGVCLSPRPGPVGTFGACGAVGACTTGLTCISLEGRDVGTCMPSCTGACDAYEGFAAECFPTSSVGDVCAVRCDPDDGGMCPTGMQCVTLAQGSSVCAR